MIIFDTWLGIVTSWGRAVVLGIANTNTKNYITGTVPANKSYVTGTVKKG